MKDPRQAYNAFTDLVEEAKDELEILKNVLTVSELVSVHSKLNEAKLEVELAYTVWEAKQEEVQKARKRRKKEPAQMELDVEIDPYPEIPF